MNDSILFSTKNDFLKIKKCKFFEFYYIEKKCLDSVSIVLLDTKYKKIGLLNEGKLAFTEREESDISFKISTINGSFIEEIKEEDYKKLEFNEQMKIATKVAHKKVLEKSGYNVLKLDFVNRSIFNYNSNEFVWLYVAEVDRYSKTHKTFEGSQEDIYSIIWFNFEDLILLEDGKVKAIMLDYFIKKNILKYTN